jgi:hypothetical protein
MSNFLNVSVLALATMVLVLAGMVGYVYWQQNKTLQVVGSLSSFVSAHLAPPAPEPEPESEPESEDDRVSVTEDKVVETVDVVVPEAKQDAKPDEDDVQTKTSSELRDILSKKGIPFGKRDSKTVLLQLIGASS